MVLTNLSDSLQMTWLDLLGPGILYLHARHVPREACKLFQQSPARSEQGTGLGVFLFDCLITLDMK